MPPRASLTSSFSVTDVNNEVVCPLRNQDGSACRKRCLGVSLSSSLPFGFDIPSSLISVTIRLVASSSAIHWPVLFWRFGLLVLLARPTAPFALNLP